MDFQFLIYKLFKKYGITIEKNCIKIQQLPDTPAPFDALLFAGLISAYKKDLNDDFIEYIIEHKDLFKKIHNDNLGRALSFIVMGELPSKAFEFLRKANLLETYYNWLYKCYGVEQNEYHAFDVYYHLIYSCDAAVKELKIRLAALFHDSGKVKAKRKIKNGEDEKDVFYNHEIIGATITYKTLKKLGFDINVCKTESKLVRNHMFHYTDQWSDGAVRRFIKKHKNYMEDLFKLRDADRRGNGKRINTPAKIKEFKQKIKKVIEYDKRLTVKDLNINGNDLMNTLDLPPSPAIGKILNHLLKIIENEPEQNNYDFLIKEAKKYLEENI